MFNLVICAHKYFVVLRQNSILYFYDILPSVSSSQVLLNKQEFIYRLSYSGLARMKQSAPDDAI